MLKLAFELGKQIALEEAGLTKEAAPFSRAVREAVRGSQAAASPGLLSKAWQAATKTPVRKGLLGAGGLAGAGGLGYGLWPKQEDPSMLQQFGATAQDILGNPEIMRGLTGALAGGGGFDLGLMPQQGAGAYEQFPPSPQMQPQQMQSQQAYY